MTNPYNSLPIVEATSIPQKAHLIYDGECPICNRYKEWVQLKDRFGAIELVNARDLDLLKRFPRLATYDLSIGMVLILPSGEILQGAAVLLEIGAITPANADGKLSFWQRLSKKATLTRLVYPFLKGIRRVLLFFQGKSPKIAHPSEGSKTA